MDKYDCFIFDCDGVLWNVEQPIEGSIETLNILAERGKKVFFVTNNSSKSRESLANKLQTFGFVAEKSQVYSSSTIAPLFLQEFYPEVKKVFLIGMREFRETLERSGLQVVHGSDLLEGSFDYEKMRNTQIDKDIDCVIVGIDYSFCYFWGMYGSMCIQNGAVFLASNKDVCNYTEWGMFPGGGSLAAFLEIATDKDAIVFGKPEGFILDVIEREHGLDTSRTIVIGDRLDTDILLGNRRGIDTLLVESGVHKSTDANRLGIHPTYILPTLSDFLTLE